MTNPRELYPVLLNSLFALFFALSLTACSTEDNFTDSQATDIPAGNQSIALPWVAPVEREDGTPITMAEISGYRVYYGTSQGNYTNEVEIADRNTMQVTLSSLPPGTYYIVVTTYDMDGRESAYSQVVARSI